LYRRQLLISPLVRLLGLTRQIDFGNAMTLQEAHAYYEDFEVQTLYYRAPEVVLGVKFDQQIDMCSWARVCHIGCEREACNING
jgi:serine/threonine protein kinase